MKDKNIFIAFILNLFFSLIEFVGGIVTNSIAIISDSIHDLGDAIGIGVSWFLERKSSKAPDEKYTYGYTRYSVLGAIITNVILLSGSIIVIYNSIIRIINPTPVNYDGMIIFAIFGFLINLIAAYVTKESDNLNEKSINLHMLEDVLGWVVVLIGSIIMRFTDISIIDPLMSIGVAIFIFIHAFKNLKEILDIFLEKIPSDVSIEEIKRHLLEIDGVIDIHHIHIRSIDGNINYATMHVVVEKENKRIKDKIRKELEEHNIPHVTLELELADEKCESSKCSVEHHHIHHHH